MLDRANAGRFALGLRLPFHTIGTVKERRCQRAALALIVEPGPGLAMHMLRSILPALAAWAAIATFPAPAAATDIVQLEAFFNRAKGLARLQLCREPFYPPGECRPARFTQGVRYNWLHASDAISNERLSVVHDEERNGHSAIFHSTLPGYGPMRFSAPGEDIWCMPEWRPDQRSLYHARLAGFREDEESGDTRIAAQYGLYVVLDSETGCEAMLAAARDMLR